MTKNVLLSFRTLLCVAFLLVTNCSLTTVQAAENQEMQQRNVKVSGVVVDEQGNPLMGVAVIVDGTTAGVSTGADGDFELNVSPTDKIIVSYIGYAEQVLNVGSRTKFKIAMKPDAQILDDVVVVGYGTQKKVNLSGSVAAVGGDVLEDRPIVSTSQGLQGVIPNLNITFTGGGDPTKSASMNVRGTGSISGKGGSPLVLVDGIPMSIDDVNPNDIKSISVLKDAGSAAIYGARGAFGVILVETKGAEKGKVVVKFNAELSLNSPIFHMDPVSDPYVYATKFNEVKEEAGLKITYDDDYLAAVKAWSEDPKNAPGWGIVNNGYRQYAFNDYRNQVMNKVAPQQKYDISLAGATEKNKYYLSMGFLSNKGFFRGDGNETFNRFNVVMKNEHQINDWLTADSKIIFNAIRADKVHSYGNDTGLQSFARVAPIRAINVPEGIPGFEYLGGDYFYSLNMLPIINKGGRDYTKKNTTWLTQGFTAKPIEGLMLRTDFSYRLQSNRIDANAPQVRAVTQNMVAGSEYNYGKTLNDFLKVTNNFNQYYVFNAFAEYNKVIGKNTFKVMGGYNQEYSRTSTSVAKAMNYATPGVSDLNAMTGTQTVEGGQNDYGLMGVFYRLNYSYDDRYLLEFNGRYDGTSRFPSDSRWGFFPSVSAAWRISEESFMESTRDVLDNLKLRASYGELGNQNVDGYYPYISTMDFGLTNYQFDETGQQMSVSAPGFVSPTLTWETVSTYNLGVDFTMFNSALDVTFDVFQRDTRDMLMNVTYPDILGAKSPQANAANLSTKGWEFAATWRDNIGKDFSYNVTVAISDSQAEITKFNNPSGAFNQNYVGKKVGEIWGLETAGIFQTDEEVNEIDQKAINSSWGAGDIRYVDQNNDKKITRGSQTLSDRGDMIIIGNTTPRYSYGVNLGLNYKAFSLTSFWQGVGKRDYYPPTGKYSWFFPFQGENIEKYWLDECWTPENPNAYFPIARFQDQNRNFVSQTRFLQDASYLRLKSLVLSYNINPDMLSQIGINSARVSLSGSNLLTFSKIHKPLDPETIYSSNMTYPVMKTYSVSLSLTF